MVALSEWQTLFSVQAEAAATLTGLVFVAVSISLAKIIASPGLPGRAAESLAQFLQVFFISSPAMIPGQPLSVFSVEIFTIAFVSWLLQVISHSRYMKSRPGHPKWWLVLRIAQIQLGSIPLFIACAYGIAGSEQCLYWLAVAFFFSFLAGVLNAWILLIEIHR